MHYLERRGKGKREGRKWLAGGRVGGRKHRSPTIRRIGFYLKPCTFPTDYHLPSSFGRETIQNYNSLRSLPSQACHLKKVKSDK